MALTTPVATEATTLTRAFYSPAEVAELASVSSSTILNYIKAGKLPAVRLSERTLRIPRKAVIHFLGLAESPPVVTDRPDADVDVDL